jgi:hypothetical protein
VRPATGWYLLLDGGIVMLVALTLSDRAHQAVARRVSIPSRPALRALAVATAVVHVAEASWAAHVVRREALSRSGRRWVTHVLVVGFPALRSLHRTVTTPAG